MSIQSNNKITCGIKTLVSILLAFSIFQVVNPYHNEVVVSSDSAIPILMASCNVWSLDDLFFWGQDRFGSFSFLLSRILLNSLGLDALVSYAVFMQAVNCLFVAVPFHIVFSRIKILPYSFLSSMYFLIIAMSNNNYYIERKMVTKGVNVDLLEIAQVNAPTLFFVFLYAFFLYNLMASEGKRKVVFFFMANICLALGAWTNTATIILTSGFLLAFLLRVFKANQYRLALTSIVGFVFAIFLNRAIVHLSSAHWNPLYRSKALALCDFSKILNNFTVVYFHSIGTLGFFFILLVAGALFSLYYFFLKNTLCPKAHQSVPHERFFKYIVAGSFVSAVFYLVAVACVKHFSNEGLPFRYLIPLWFFLIIILLTTLLILFQLLPIKTAITIFALPLIATGWHLGALHEYKENTIYLQSVALAKKSGSIGLIGSYWNSYVYSFFLPKTIIATTHQHDSLRSESNAKRVIAQKRIVFNFQSWNNTYQNRPPTKITIFNKVFKLVGPFIKEKHNIFWEYELLTPHTKIQIIM